MQVDNLSDLLARELSACANLYGWGRRDFDNTLSQWAGLLRPVYDYPAAQQDLTDIFLEWRVNETKFPAPQVILAKLSCARSKWRAVHTPQNPGPKDGAHWATLCLAAFRGDEAAREELYR